MLPDQILGLMLGRSAQVEIAQRESAQRVHERELRRQAQAEAFARERRVRDRINRDLAIRRLDDKLISIRAAGIVERVNLRTKMRREVQAMKSAPIVVR